MEIDEFLAHHGVKGMHWGVRKDRSSSAGGSSRSWTPANEQELKTSYQQIPAIRRTPEEAAKNLRSNQAKFANKLDPPDDESGHNLSERQKKALEIGAGIAAVGAAAGLAYYLAKNGNLKLPGASELPEGHVSIGHFEKRVAKTQSEFWGSTEFTTRESFERPEITLPSGHVFHRLSRAHETGFGDATYTSSNLDDFGRYIVTHAAADSKNVFSGSHHVSFKAEKPLKIPNLTTAVEILRHSMSEGTERTATQKEALALYNGLSGGSWDSPEAKSFIKVLKERGYDGIVDEMDAGVVSNKPLVIFSHEKLSPKISKALTDKDVISAARNLTDIDYVKKLEQLSFAHHGVKGMHWGIRKERDTSGSGNQAEHDLNALGNRAESLTDKDKSVLKAAGLSPSQAPAMEAKYGPDSAGNAKHHLTEGQKKAIVYGAIAAAFIGYTVYESKTHDSKLIEGMVKNGVKRPTAEYLIKSDAAKGIHAKGLSAQGLNRLNAEDLHFEPGHVFKRVSTEIEKEIRPEGFYASHKPEDVERYKAVLPIYWKLWESTAGKTSGYVNHYASSSHIKIASEKTIYDTLKKSLDQEVRKGMTMRHYLSTYVTGGSGRSDDELLLRKSYYHVVENFALADPNSNDAVKHLIKALKESGYHGIVDSNDAGSLSSSPVKILDGTIFKIVGHEVLSESAIASAQEAITSLAHLLRGYSTKIEKDAEVRMETDEYIAYFRISQDELAHHGVKGMKWGEHHARRMARADANEFAKARAYYGQGAGTRRKLIKAKVETRSQNPHYKKEFERVLSGQNAEKRSAQATRKRHRQDTKNYVGKQARSVHRSLTGGFGPVTAVGATIATGATYAHKTGLDKKVYNKIKTAASNKSTHEQVRQFLKDQGIG